MTHISIVSDYWLEKTIESAVSKVATWPQWKQDLMRERLDQLAQSLPPIEGRGHSAW